MPEETVHPISKEKLEKQKRIIEDACSIIDYDKATDDDDDEAIKEYTYAESHRYSKDDDRDFGI